MNQLKHKMQKAFQQAKSKLTNLILDEEDNERGTPSSVALTVELDRDMYVFLQQKAEYEQTTEPAVIAEIVKQHFRSRTLGIQSSISHGQKENNPLFLLDNMTKTLK